MTIQISCSALAFNGQKARKLFVPLAITVFAPSDIPLGAQCHVRVSLISSPTAGVFSIQAIPGTWDVTSTPGTLGSVLSTAFFDPNLTLPSFTAFPAFFDSSNPTAPSPPPGYSATYQVDVVDGSQVYGSVQFVVTGMATAQQSVDVVFALDHGSSMNSSVVTPNRLDRLKSAFPRAVALLRGDDRLGVISFANLGSTPPFNPQLPCGQATFAQREAATALGTGLGRDNTAPLKSIQMAIEAARVLSPTAMLVLVTDGTNVNPPGHVLVPPSLPTSAMIIGDFANQIPSTATKMVSADGHYAYASSQALGEFAIEKLLTQILIGLSGSTFISDPDGALEPGESQSFPLQLTEADHELDVIVFSNDAPVLKVTVDDLERGDSPHSHYRKQQPCDDPSDDDPTRGEGFVITRVPLPKLPPLGHGPPAKVIISRAPAASRHEAPPVRFNLLVVARTDLMLDAQVMASGNSVGSDLLFSAVLTQYGLTWQGTSASVHVELSHPDGGVQILHLENTAPGRYQASLRSFRAGAYTAHFIAVGKSLQQHRPFRRECVRTVAVYASGDCCQPSDPCATVFSRT